MPDRRIAQALLLTCLALLGCFTASISHARQLRAFAPPFPGPLSRECDDSLWVHLHRPERLTVLEECVELTATIKDVSPREDGDLHIRLRPDEPYRGIVNTNNHLEIGGDIIAEPICYGDPVNPEAVESCGSFRKRLNIPPVGAHVRVVGSFVIDHEHGWTEIHPVSIIEEIP
jgi:hypothetical protein